MNMVAIKDLVACTDPFWTPFTAEHGIRKHSYTRAMLGGLFEFQILEGLLSNDEYKSIRPLCCDVYIFRGGHILMHVYVKFCSDYVL